MKKHTLMALVLAGGATVMSVRATDTNRLVLSSDALAAMAAGNTGEPLSKVGPTNQPAWSGTVAAGLTLTSGNSESVLTTAAVNVRHYNPTNEWNLGGDGAYGENQRVENTETLHGFSQFNHQFDARWYGYARGDALHDGIADVDYRLTASPGAGYYFIKSRRTMLAGESGPSAVSEELDDEGGRYYMSARVAERFEHKIDDRTRLWNNLELLPQVDRPDNFLVNLELGVESALTKKISLRTVLQDNFANEPAPGHKDNDVKLVSGLGYKF